MIANKQHNKLQNFKSKLVHNAFRRFFDLNSRFRLIKFKSWEGVEWKKISKFLFKEKEIYLNNKYGQTLKVRTDQLTDFTAVYGRKDESEILNLLEKILNENSVFIDCGAHIGRYTLIASTFIREGGGGAIIAVEPFIDNYLILEENIKINHISKSKTNIRALNVALGNDDGEISLNIGKDCATNTVDESWLDYMEQNHGIRKVVKVKLRKLDNIIKESNLKSIDLLKIDVEGAELDVLKGAIESIGNRKVKNIICEIHEPVASRKEIISMLKSYNYNIKNIGSSEILAVLD